MKKIVTPQRIVALSGILGMTALMLSFSWFKGDDDKKTKRKIEKRIEVVEENGEKKVTVTTIENGNKKVETYTGEKAEEFLRNNDNPGAGNFHMSFDFDVDTLSGKNSFDFSMNGFGEEFEAEMKKMMEQLNDSGMHMMFDFGNMFKSLDTAFSGNNFKMYSFDFGDSMDDLDSLLNGSFNFNIYTDEDGDKDNDPAAHQRKTVMITRSVVMEDVDRKNAEKDLHVTDLSFYPNPNGGNFTLRYKSDSMDMIDIAVSDINGKTVYNERVSATGTILRDIELNEPSGTYILTLRQGKKKASKKLIIK